MSLRRRSTVPLVSAALLASSFGLSACGGGADADTASGAESGAASSGTYDGTVTIARSSWIGFLPLDLAVEQGFFEDHGVDVAVTSFESKADSRAALIAGEIQGIATTIDTQVMSKAQGMDITVPLVLDTSYGGDGLVGLEDITSFADLKGRTVALDTTGGASFFWFNYELKQNDMTMDDIEVTSMSSGDAGSAFVAGKVDAAMTWEPWLSKAKETDFGHVILDSKDVPGVILDTLGLSSDFVAEYPETVQGIVDGWFDALAFLESNKGEAVDTMAKASGLTVEDLEGELSGIQFYTREENATLFGTTDAPGDLVDVANTANDLWVETGLTDSKADVASLLDPSFVQ